MDFGPTSWVSNLSKLSDDKFFTLFIPTRDQTLDRGRNKISFFLARRHRIRKLKRAHEDYAF